MSKIAEIQWKSASIIPICSHNGKRFMLLGRESAGYSERSKNWDTFGGGREEIDKSPKDTAIREFDEETMGVFGSTDYIREKLHKVHVHIKNTMHYVYILQIPYDPIIVETYNRILSKMRDCFRTKKVTKDGIEMATLYLPTCPKGLFEKTMLSWFPIKNVLASPELLRTQATLILPGIFKKLEKYLD